MLSDLKPFTSLSYLLTALTIMLCIPSYADSARITLPNDENPTVTDNDEEGLEKTLEQNFSPEDRARLRKALIDYARNTDPEHEQIQLRRQAMKESIAQRFNECDQDNDSSLDRREATMCLPQIARHFNYVDVDEDNLITLEELELAQAKSAERRKAAEARLEAQRLQRVEEEIKNKAKEKNVSDIKQTVAPRKRPI